MEPALRIALLTYRGNPHSGGQGVYTRYLSAALADLGHHVEVFAGPPYPDLRPGVVMNPLPSLDLYRADDPFRTPRRDEFRDWIDVLEFASMCTASFPEPLTFTLRAARRLGRGPRFDVVHDNQSLGYGLLGIARRTPVVATVHHPCSIDRDIEIAHAPTHKKRASLRRWYSFTKMQARVARRLPALITVSEAACDDVVREFDVPRHNVRVVHNGVDPDLFKPLPHAAREPGRIITTASADVPLKGLPHLVEAVAKLRTEDDSAHLVVIGREPERGPVRTAIERYGLNDHITFETGVSWERLVELYATACVAVVPSLYEGFSLPAIEAMSCAVPLVATRAGALPEVVGADGEASLLVAAGDAGEMAAALRRVLQEEALAHRMGHAARRRVLERFTWRRAASETADVYREAIERC